MKATGIVRSIDSLGRLVLPMELRRKLDIAESNTDVEIFVEDDKVILKKYQPSCIFCNNEDDIVTMNGKNICKSCIEKIKNLD